MNFFKKKGIKKPLKGLRVLGHTIFLIDIYLIIHLVLDYTAERMGLYNHTDGLNRSLIIAFLQF